MENNQDYQEISFIGKKVLVFGLGLLGGGVATTNWFLKRGAKVTVTDLKTKNQLQSSLKKIRGRVKLSLGGHREGDIKANEIIVVNPDVSINNPYIQLAFQLGKQVENEAIIFFKNFQKPIVAVTGTRGKTTTANWIAHFLNAKYKTTVAGNSCANPFLKILDRQEGLERVVVEVPSFALEFFDNSALASDTAVITNIYQDHLNRHQSLENYAKTKANIFRNQNSNQNLVLNFGNKWTNFFLKQKSRSKIWFFSVKLLPPKLNGVFIKNDNLFFQDRGLGGKIVGIKNFKEKWGEHNLQNLLASSLVAHLSGISWSAIQGKIKNLPQIPFRQEIVFDNSKLKIVNDTTATSPDGGMAAIERFGSPHTILIAGGTDCRLDYRNWAKLVREHIKPENLILLSSNATQKMKTLLNCGEIFTDLRKCLKTALRRASQYPQSVILFSPAAKSFEKFENEYDRGRQFNSLVKQLIK